MRILVLAVAGWLCLDWGVKGRFSVSCSCRAAAVIPASVIPCILVISRTALIATLGSCAVAALRPVALVAASLGPVVVAVTLVASLASLVAALRSVALIAASLGSVVVAVALVTSLIAALASVVVTAALAASLASLIASLAAVVVAAALVASLTSVIVAAALVASLAPGCITAVLGSSRGSRLNSGLWCLGWLRRCGSL